VTPTKPPPLTPPPTLLVKLGSIAVHLDEYMSPRGHIFDRVAAESLLRDPEVKRWLKAMDKLGMLPVKR